MVWDFCAIANAVNATKSVNKKYKKVSYYIFDLLVIPHFFYRFNNQNSMDILTLFICCDIISWKSIYERQDKMSKNYNIKIDENFYDEDDNIEINIHPTERQMSRRRAAAYKKTKKKKKRSFKAFIILAIIFILFFTVILPPRQTVFLIAGTDESGTRTDTLMLGVLNAGFKSELTLISIPRDTLISVSEKSYTYMRSEYPEPAHPEMKINEIYHFSGEKKGMNILANEIENKFDVKVDYYAKIDFDALTHIVDSIGGVTFDVPMNMNYEDPLQGLSIHLKKGVQVLNGAQAEQLIRYRAGYARADLERVEVQQQFIKAFLSQALTPKNVMSHLGNYISICNEYVDTNVNLLKLVRYAGCVPTINFSEFETATMPGTTGYAYGRSGYIVDLEEFSELYGDKYR